MVSCALYEHINNLLFIEMMKMKNNSRVLALIVVSIFCLTTCSCERIFEKKDPFRVISLGSLTNDIPFEELGSGKIVFQRNYLLDSIEFYVIDIDQKRSWGFRLNSSIRHPSVSPDGSKIACSIYDDEFPHTLNIHCMKTDGSSCFQIPQSAGGDYPTWTPDGSHILYFISEGPLYMISATENANDRVTMVDFLDSYDPNICIHPSGGFSMSLDGQLLCSSIGGCSHSVGILKIEPQVLNGVSILLPKPINGEPVSPVYSPDGMKIAFALLEYDSIEDQHTISINTMDPDGTNITSLVSIETSKEALQFTFWGFYYTLL